MGRLRWLSECRVPALRGMGGRSVAQTRKSASEQGRQGLVGVGAWHSVGGPHEHALDGRSSHQARCAHVPLTHPFSSPIWLGASERAALRERSKAPDHEPGSTRG